MAFQINDGDEVPLALEVFDRDGNPAAIDGDPQGASSDTSLIMVRVENGEIVAATVPGPGLGTATVTVTVDADRGEGVTSISASLDLEVIAGDAVAINIVPGAPRPRLEEAPPEEPPVP